MKKAYIFVLTIIILLLETGCQSTPEETVVIGKGDGQLEEKISAQTNAPLPSDMPESGTHIVEQFKHESLDITIDVDAVVDTQDGKTMPAARVEPYRFTQQDVDRVYEHFVADAHFFRKPDEETWAFLAGQAIDGLETRLAYAEECGYDEDHIQRIKDRLDEARQNYLYAKEGSEFAAVSHKLCKENLVFGGDLTEGIYGYFEKGDSAYRLVVANDENGMSSMMTLERLRKDDEDEFIYEEMMGFGKDVSYLDDGDSLRELDYEEALSMARETADVFGADDMVLAHAEAKQYPADTLESYYTFIFTHQVNGVPCIYNAIAIANDEGYNDIWDYEKLIIAVDRHGVKSARWYSPCKVTKQLADSAAIIPFEQVMQCFSKMIFIKNCYWESDLETVITFEGCTAIYTNKDVVEVDIDENTSISVGEGNENSYAVGSIMVYVKEIKIGLMRVQSGTDFLLIPVWVFYGYKERFTTEGESIEKLQQDAFQMYSDKDKAYCLLTINALDGSVIDLEKGF